MAEVHWTPIEKRMRLIVDKKDIRKSGIAFLFKMCGFSFKKKGRIKSDANIERRKVSVNGGICATTIFVNTPVEPPIMTEVISANTASFFCLSSDICMVLL